jgi:hypothetical protein
MQACVPPFPASARKRILIVEDHDLSLKLPNDILESRGYATIATLLRGNQDEGPHCLAWNAPGS